MSTAQLFAHDSAAFLRDTYLPRLERALANLDPEDLWWRPHPDVISVGTVLLHLEGNVRQWLLSGMKGEPDHRDRALEFAAQDGPPAMDLFERLSATVRAAASFVAGLDDAALQRTYTIQGFEVTGLQAVLHVVEHFSWHTGQVVWIAKARAGQGHGIAFYDDDAVNRARND